MTTPIDVTTGMAAQRSPDPAEDRPEPGPPSPDGDPRPELRAPGEAGDELPARLGERIGAGPSDGGAIDDPDLLPDVQVPETSM